MGERATITYRDFYDVPRMFLVSYDGDRFLFDCRFDDELDDYPDTYRVFLMPSDGKLDLEGSWEHLPDVATKYLGEARVSAINFDESRRCTIGIEVLKDLVKRKAA